MVLRKPPAVESVVVNGTPGTSLYVYCSVDVFLDGTTTGCSAETALSGTAIGPAALGGADTITVITTGDPEATRYDLYRFGDDGGGGLLPPVLVYSGTNRTFTDDGTATATRYPPGNGNRSITSGVSGLVPEVLDIAANILLSARQRNVVVANTGATGTVVVTMMESPSPGTSVTAMVTSARALYLKGAGSQTFRRTTATGACITSNTVGNVVTVVYLGFSKWITTSYTGTWTPGACP